MRRTIWLLAILVITLICVLVFGQFKNAKTTKQIPQIAELPPSEQLNTHEIKGVSFNALAQFTLPGALPLYTMQPFTAKPWKKLMSELSWKQVVLPDSFGEDESWSGKSGSFSVSFPKEGQPNVSLQLLDPAANLFISPTTPLPDIAQLLKNMFAYPNTEWLSLESTKKSRATDLPNSSNQSIIYSVSYKIDSHYPLLFATYSTNAVNIVTDAQGNILTLRISYPPLLEKRGGESILLLNQGGVLRSLNEGRGLFLWATDKPTDVYATKPIFTNFLVSDVSTTYYADYGSTTLRPVFVVSGTGTTNGKTQQAQYLLYATGE